MPCPNCRCPSCLALVDPLTLSTSEFSPPPAELMTTNRAPAFSEVAYARGVIRFVDKTVSVVQGMIDGLEKRKAELLDFASTHKVTISPLRTFPPELLAKIFLDFVTVERPHTPRPSRSPFMLMGICSRWRRIVLDTPRLWTQILGASPMVNSRITRSKELPLYLELNFNSSNSYPVLEALIPHSRRWEHINFSLGLNSRSALARVRAHLSSLKRLVLFFGNTTGTVDFCEVAPQLTEIRLMGIHQPVIIKLPWEQLVVCALDNSGLALYVLQHAKNLRTCHLDMSDLEDPSWLSTPRDPHACHPGLDTLVIHWSLVDPSIDSFFSSITLPSLRTLEIDFDSAYLDYIIDDDSPELACRTMSGFFKRSSEHLSTLNLANIPFSPSILIECLALVPSLVSLDIQFDKWYAISNELLHRLNASLHGYILPRLRSLSLQGPSVFSEESLDALVTSRRHINPTNDGVALLENLTLKCSIPGGQSTDRLPRFHRFVLGGLSITYGKDWDVYNSIQAGSLGE
ncbi:hypothetical protein BD779DRAFT_919171 [Infundibulicybe gibba]|nr:hypothetical protein BD779DRAFT_919171 [Infundibulicybe gibba]